MKPPGLPPSRKLIPSQHPMLEQPALEVAPTDSGALNEPASAKESGMIGNQSGKTAEEAVPGSADHEGENGPAPEIEGASSGAPQDPTSKGASQGGDQASTDAKTVAAHTEVNPTNQSGDGSTGAIPQEKAATTEAIGSEARARPPSSPRSVAAGGASPTNQRLRLAASSSSAKRFDLSARWVKEQEEEAIEVFKESAQVIPHTSSRFQTNFICRSIFDFLLLLLLQAVLAFAPVKTRLHEDAQVQKLQLEIQQLIEQLKLNDATLAKQGEELVTAQSLALERLKDNVALHKVLDGKYSSD